MAFNWKAFDRTGSFVKFANVGDSIVGTVVAVREGRDFDGAPTPEVVLDDGTGDDKVVTVAQVVLMAAMAEVEPQEGDRCAVQYLGVGQAQPGKSPAKLFLVEVSGPAGVRRSTAHERMGGQSPAAPQVAAPTPSAPAQPAPAPAPATGGVTARSLL